MMFQFHSGSIKRGKQSRSEWAQCLCFNSIVVRLKGERCATSRHGRAGFQFHSGSIKSPTDPKVAEAVVKFQFHSGSIKSVGELLTVVEVCSVSIP